MQNKFFLLYFIFSFLTLSTYSQPITVGMIKTSNMPDTEFNAAFAFAKRMITFNTDTVFIQSIKKVDELAKYDILWIHSTDELIASISKKSIKIIKEYLTGGGKVLLTLESVQLISNLGLENNGPFINEKKIEDKGYGRKAGLHAFRNHPVFEGLNGGAYLFKPLKDTNLRVLGYFEETKPENGKVIAVDWDYINLVESSKIILEYSLGSGRLMAIGGYTYFSLPNLSKEHLNKFMENCFTYLTNDTLPNSLRYWNHDEQEVISFEPQISSTIASFDEFEKMHKGNMVLTDEKPNNQYWDIAGERILIMGKENGGIEEIWSHPFMILKDYKAGIINNEKITWLNQQVPIIEVRPGSFIRKYSIDGFELTEKIAVSLNKPNALISYQYNGDTPLDIICSFKSNQRFMWPYSEHVYKSLKYSYDSINHIFIFGVDDDILTYVSSLVKPESSLIGQYDEISPGVNGDNLLKLSGSKTENFEIAAASIYKLSADNDINLFISSDIKPIGSDVLQKEPKGYRKKRYALDFGLMVKSPDETFNEGYRWALSSTESFFVNTPGIGKSVVAGYGTTQKGWDGGHEINGRPGYSWYFGRDGQWSGFAMLDYGDFDKVRDILATYLKFQDLNGKIYHELTTSGAVHYDAADATPLFIILAGKYLRHSGDIKFIQNNWLKIKKAVYYCFSTDTDNDLLIENTNVGHGWVEGGVLFGSHSSLYLTSCWAKALEETAYMANVLKVPRDSKSFSEKSKKVRQIINNNFWNEKAGFFKHGKYVNNAFIEEKTVMSAIPILFGLSDPDKPDQVLPIFAQKDFSSDWGCRILSSESKLYNPKGYHNGSVWPLFTGWVSLAEYKAGRSTQGFTHIMNNLNVYKTWGLGHIEEVLNGNTYEPSGVCHNQSWSETMAIQPVIEGLLGFKPDAVNNILELSPQFPAHWNDVTVTNMRIGKNMVNITMKRISNEVTFQFTQRQGNEIQLIFLPKFEPGTIIQEIVLPDNTLSKASEQTSTKRILLQKSLTITYKLKNGISILPVIPHPSIGSTTKEIKIINEVFENNIYSIDLESFGPGSQEIKVFIRDQEINQIENGELIDQTGNIYKIRITKDKPSNNWQNLNIKIHLK